MPDLKGVPIQALKVEQDGPTSVDVSALAPEPSVVESHTRTWGDFLTDLIPAAGATVGGATGGVLGAGLGGAAGKGFQTLVEKGKEIPGAIKDIAGNLLEHPREIVSGFAAGAKAGATDAGIAGAENAALEGAGNAVMAGVREGSKAVYRGYLKPSLAGASVKKAQQIVNTAIEEALPITKEGAATATRVAGEIKDQVEAILTNRNNISKFLHGDIDLHAVANQVRDFARKSYYKAGRPVEDFEAAMKVADNIDAHPAVTTPGSIPGPTPVSLTEANEVKRALDSSLGERAFGVERSASQEAEKAGRRILREEIEKRAPVGPLNAREGKLIDAAKAITRAVEREANQNSLVGVKTIAAAGAGGYEYQRTGDPWGAAAKALAVRYALRPEVASRLALATFRIGKLPGVAPASAARLALEAMTSEE